MSNDEKTGRRGFLAAGVAVASGGIGAAAGFLSRAPAGLPATSRAIAKSWVPGAERFRTGEERFIATTCDQCPAGCGIRVRVVEGRAVRIEGNPAHPVSRGGIGPRGIAALQTVYDPARYRAPLLRENGRFVPVSWERAMSVLAERASAIRKTPEKLFVISGDVRGTRRSLWARFCRAFGTPNHVFDEGALAAAMERVTGVRAEPVFDWARASTVLSLESGLLEDRCPSPRLARAVADMRASRRGRLVHASPMFDLTAQTSDEWLLIEPGTGGVLALGIAQLLVVKNVHDARAADSIPNFSALAAWLRAKFFPERVAAITGVSVEAMERIVRDLTEHRPSFAYADERSLAFSNGAHTAHAMLTLNALLGALGTVIKLPAHAPLADWGGAMTASGNPDVAIVDLAEIRPRERALLEHASFVACFASSRDAFADERADLVLPTHSFLERWDDSEPSPPIGAPVVSIRRPAIDPLYDTRDPAELIFDLARALSIDALPWRTFRDAFEERARGLFESRIGNVITTSEHAFFRKLYDVGFWHDPVAEPLPIPRMNLAPDFEEPAWTGDDREFPLRVVRYRAPDQGAEPWLRRVRPRPDAPRGLVASVHPDSAQGFSNGERARLVGPDVDVVLRLDERVALACVAVAGDGLSSARARIEKRLK